MVSLSLLQTVIICKNVLIGTGSSCNSICRNILSSYSSYTSCAISTALYMSLSSVCREVAS